MSQGFVSSNSSVGIILSSSPTRRDALRVKLGMVRKYVKHLGVSSVYIQSVRGEGCPFRIHRDSSIPERVSPASLTVISLARERDRKCAGGTRQLPGI